MRGENRVRLTDDNVRRVGEHVQSDGSQCAGSTRTWEESGQSEDNVEYDSKTRRKLTDDNVLGVGGHGHIDG